MKQNFNWLKNKRKKLKEKKLLLQLLKLKENKKKLRNKKNQKKEQDFYRLLKTQALNNIKSKSFQIPCKMNPKCNMVMKTFTPNQFLITFLKISLKTFSLVKNIHFCSSSNNLLIKVSDSTFRDSKAPILLQQSSSWKNLLKDNSNNLISKRFYMLLTSSTTIDGK